MTNPMARIAAERRRQIEKWGAEHDPGNGCWLAVLGEEYGEVCKEICDPWPGSPNHARLEVELVQMAAVAVAWIEAIERRRKDDPFSEQ